MSAPILAVGPDFAWWWLRLRSSRLVATVAVKEGPTGELTRGGQPPCW